MGIFDLFKKKKEEPKKGIFAPITGTLLPPVPILAVKQGDIPLALKDTFDGLILFAIIGWPGSSFPFFKKLSICIFILFLAISEINFTASYAVKMSFLNLKVVTWLIYNATDMMIGCQYC